MSRNLDRDLKEYVKDAKKIHTEEHGGSFEECKETMCRLAVNIETGDYSGGVIQDIEKGK